MSTIRKSPTRPEPTRGPLGDYTVAAIQLAALAGLWGTLIGLTVGLVMALVIL